jgi:hypothetical protein
MLGFLCIVHTQVNFIDNDVIGLHLGALAAALHLSADLVFVAQLRHIFFLLTLVNCAVDSLRPLSSPSSEAADLR